MAVRRSWFDAPPSAARLTGSLRDIGYDFPTAVADLVDNSISAGAQRVGVELVFDPNNSYVLIWDDGTGMGPTGLLEALRFGSRREYNRNELGRFGLGLKTGSFSQCRRLTVVSRTAPKQPNIHVRTLDLDFIERVDSWSVLADEESDAVEHAKRILSDGPGTVVAWENLDRVLPDRYAESGWGRRRLSTLAKKTGEHLGMVFHRFITGSHGATPVAISVNGDKLEAWDPFATSERHTQTLPREVFEIESDEGSADIIFTGYVLPPRDQFSSPERFERMSGPLKWNRQQGLYIYRANRLVQFGGWNGLRGIDEHTKLARASIDFDTDLDETFQINVAKMSVVLPATLKNMLERPIHDLCVRADAAYRQAASASEERRKPARTTSAEGVALREIGIALKAAVLESSDLAGFKDALATFKARHPDLSKSLGL
ncbi:ATP-binding protein [Jiangella ureilytica]|uniref:ATP-binding protein n=1 Tax=Jiangella ureilytica TaxID=2530374 RepID=A0A4R4RRY6_9ACTN|nr:ATP-binding protein [Jiangella ureilytica]TDC52009.1 ATP-binding protein [Jiangella ureilytica]